MNQIDLQKLVSRLIDGTGPYERAPTICVAVSGGGDSMALALLAASWAEEQGGRVVALTVDHQLRSESYKETQRVSEWMSAHNIEHHVLTWCNPQGGSALQENARTARYELMEQWCRDHGALHLFLAHNKEDQAETFLMRLDKGSGPDGLSAMSAVSERRYCRLVRPLLSVSKSDLRTYLAGADQNWIEDPSNTDTKFERIRWRNIMNEQNISPDGYCQSARRYGQARSVLDGETARLAAKSVSVHPAGYIRICRAVFNAAPPEIGGRVLARSLMVVGGAVYPPRRQNLEALLAAIIGKPHVVRTLGGCRIEATSSDLVITREFRYLPSAICVNAGLSMVWDKRFYLSIPIFEHGRSLNVYLQPLGDLGDAEFKEVGQLGSIVGIPSAARKCLPALYDEDGVISVPHLNYSRMESEHGKGGHIAQFGEATFCSLNSLSGSGYFVAN